MSNAPGKKRIAAIRARVVCCFPHVPQNESQTRENLVNVALELGDCFPIAECNSGHELQAFEAPARTLFDGLWFWKSRVQVSSVILKSPRIQAIRGHWHFLDFAGWPQLKPNYSQSQPNSTPAPLASLASSTASPRSSALASSTRCRRLQTSRSVAEGVSGIAAFRATPLARPSVVPHKPKLDTVIAV